MVTILAFVGAVVTAFLPSRYRGNLQNRNASLVSAILEGFLAVCFIVARIYEFVSRPGLMSDDQAKQMFTKYGGLFYSANAVAGAANFWLDPIVLLSLFFFSESIIRVFSAIEGSTTMGSLPLYAISAVHKCWERVAYRRFLGELIIDEVVPGNKTQDYAVMIRSCRPKLEWNRQVSIEFRGEFFECFREEQGPSPRRFIYYLRKSPPGRLVVVVLKYMPGDVLQPLVARQ